MSTANFNRCSEAATVLEMSATRTAAIVLALVLVLAGSAFTIYSYTRKVTGVSMLPTLEEGDLVVVLPAQLNQITLGDIIVYGPPCSSFGESVIHRVVAETGSGLTTKGDNNPAPDQTVGIANRQITQSCLEGKVVFVIPYLERLSELPYGINYVIAALIVLFVIYTELSSWRPRKDEKGTESSAETAHTVEANLARQNCTSCPV